MDRHLEVFIKVVEKENFPKAGEELHMSQPAVSQYIKDFEETLGTRLLERSNRYVYMNKAGEIVYRYAKEILALYGKMQLSLDELTNHAGGPLSIGASYTFGEYILPRVIAKLREKYPLVLPGVKIGNTQQIIELVDTHQIDIGIIEGSFHHDKLYSKVIAFDEMYIVASPGHPSVNDPESVRSISDLKDEMWILREKGSGTREAAEKLFELYNINPGNIMEFGSTQLIKESVKKGWGSHCYQNGPLKMNKGTAPSGKSPSWSCHSNGHFPL